MAAIPNDAGSEGGKAGGRGLALGEAAEGDFIVGEAMNAWIESWDTEAELSAPKADVTPDTE